MVKRSAWLSITPEPERELPEAVSTLRYGPSSTTEAAAHERARIESLILTGSQRQWLAYLSEVIDLIDRTATDEDEEVQRARARAIAVISNHHNLLLGLPGTGARRTAAERARLSGRA